MFLIPFRAEHLIDLEEIQSVQIPDFALGTEFNPERMVDLEKKGMAYTMIGENERPILCAGVFSIWPQRAHAWMLGIIDWHKNADLREGLKFARKILAAYPSKRIEATVLTDWEPGHTLVRHLGFTMEARRLRCYDPEGRDFSLYARIRG